MRKLSVLFIPVFSICSACFAAEQPPARPSTVAPVSEKGAATPGEKTVPVDAKTYVIGAEDVLLIKVWHEPELTAAYIVRPDGKISMPLVSEIQAAGLTPEKLSSGIAESLSKFMTHPEVSVALQTVNSKRYFIVGEVQRTGAFPLVVPTTVMEALANAGGFKDFSNKKKIVIIRGKQRLPFNYNEVVKGKHAEQNVLLETGDQIVVP